MRLYLITEQREVTRGPARDSPATGYVMPCYGDLETTDEAK